ncbi:Histone-lysine N-methyltransferase SETMAR [Eumeta japonica]|uniref:Histone-lysine N-methyltransferase SETMAR n=1 Tax=Eumeta variegata TaxID=151549 RepID=A0A4C1WFT6_EUMVA|nr:Histone-lysine N-methyltransferase SETMAR [Eumeta japonica]
MSLNLITSMDELVGLDTSGNFDVKNEPCYGQLVTDKVDAILEKANQDRHISSYYIAEELKIDHKTVSPHLKKARYRKKLDTWVSHELIERNLMNHVLTYDSLLKRNKTELFLKRLITGDKRAIIHYELLPPGKTIDSDLHYQQLMGLKKEVEKKRREPINRNGNRLTKTAINFVKEAEFPLRGEDGRHPSTVTALGRRRLPLRPLALLEGLSRREKSNGSAWPIGRTPPQPPNLSVGPISFFLTNR